MNLNIKATNVTLTPELHAACEKKLASLKHFLDLESPNVFIHAELAKASAHHATGDVFQATVTIRNSGKITRATAEGKDLIEALDKVKDELAREMKGTKGKRVSLLRRGALRIKNMLRFGRDIDSGTYGR